MGLYDFTFYDLIERNAFCRGDLPAWYEADDRTTRSFAQLKSDVDKLAAGLQHAGLKKGDRIGVLGKNCLEYFLLYGAAAAVGAVVLPVNWRLSVEEVCFNLTDCEPVFLFADAEFQADIAASKEKLTSIRTYYNLRAGQGEFEAFDSLVGTAGEMIPVDVSGDDGFVIIHTAAVAGRPRGALLSHGNVMWANLHWLYCFNLSHNDVHLNCLPLFHVGGLFMATSSFHAGALTVNMSKFDAGQALALIEEKRVSFFFDFAPILASVLDHQEKTGGDLSSLRLVAGLDTPETIEKYQRVTGGTFYSLYGQTETSSVATYGKYNDRPGSAGRPISVAGMRLVDDADRPVLPGETGEIVVKGPMVFKGYWNLPEDNARTFRNGWHHTGDLGRFDEDGFLFYAGRKPEKELIKPGGENVYPAEVEAVILEHPAVEKTVVIGVPDPKWKEGIKAVCQLKPGETLDSAGLISFVGSRIAGFKKPQYVEFVEAIPETNSGKPDRAAVKELYGGDQPDNLAP
jgi:acyl-CoA synthetase (AMP-forming)/AMP-acid ligase II